jgi:hypothetical protein
MACRLIDQGRLPSQAIITHTVDLKDYAEAFSELGVELTARTVTPTARHIKVILTTCDPG